MRGVRAAVLRREMSQCPPPSADEIAACAAVLRRLSPSDLDHPWADELRAAGLALFSRAANKLAFNGKEVKDFLAEQSKHKKTLAELKRLEALVNGAWRRERIQANECGMNEARKAQLELIKQECLKLADSTRPNQYADRITDAGQTVACTRLQWAAARCDSVRIQLDFTTSLPGGGAAASERSTPQGGVWSGLGGGHGEVDGIAGNGQRRELPPEGDLRRICNVCRGDCTHLPRHPFYHHLCPRCGDFNLEKREQTGDMTGMYCLVTGARVRIGYATALKLLRAGATVVTTTRFPCDAAKRYAAEPDFHRWHARLSIVGPLELSDLALVERFCDALLESLPRLDVLINNAAQTLTRPAGWHVRMAQLEERSAADLPPRAQMLLRSPSRVRGGAIALDEAPAAAAAAVAAAAAAADAAAAAAASASAAAEDAGAGGALSRVAQGGSALSSAPLPSSSAPSLRADALVSRGPSATAAEEEEARVPREMMAAFPANHLDESRQPLDLSGVNSWSRRLGEIGTLEMAQTLAANAAAPFVLCNRLAPLLRRSAVASDADGSGGAATRGGRCSLVVNVTAVEGKFSVGKKSHAHPHTNMGKAALNMLTFTSAQSLYQQYQTLMNSVDTGWVTDMAPCAVGVTSARHATWVGPPLDEVDGAARVLDPVFCHLKQPDKWRIRGYCFRNYFVAGW